MPDYVLRFGIPSLDRLITGAGTSGRRNSIELPSGIALAGRGSVRGLAEKETTSIAIIGPDGTGKSVLGLHLASRYAADCWERGAKQPYVLYVSTDLNYEVALHRLWNAFWLDVPAARKIPFARKKHYPRPEGPETEVKLTQIHPLSNMADFLQKPDAQERRRKLSLEVGFVDLARNTVGDDWGYLTRLLGLLPPLDGHEPNHLVVIDAVEGFEMLVGDRDAFGEPASRRARIAQIMRIAAFTHNCNVVLIAEEAHRDERLPEVFITDFVIRLRDIESHGYLRRTMQVEKARGYSHARGQHPFVIRSGHGSTTGRQKNYDDPAVRPELPAVLNTKERQLRKSQAYFHIFRSLHYLSRTTMQRSGSARPPVPRNSYAGFGIRNLDDMLAGHGVQAQRRSGKRDDDCGVPSCSVTALIGDSETQKTRLGRAFLSRCFASYHDNLVRLHEAIGQDLIHELPDFKAILKRLGLPRRPTYGSLKNRAEKADIAKRLTEYAKAKRLRIDWHEPSAGRALIAAWLLFEAEPAPEEGVPILITTHDVDSASVAGDFSHFLLPDTQGSNDARILRLVAEHHFQERTICRRLEIHDLSSAILMHIVSSCVQQAQRMQLADDVPPESEKPKISIHRDPIGHR